MTISSCIHVAADAVISSFLWLSRIPLCTHTHTYPKINSKLIKQQNIRVETIKVLEEITRQKLHDTGLGNDTYGTDNKRENRKTGLRED